MSEQKQWPDGGLPPVGTECEGMHEGEWHKVKVLENCINSHGDEISACRIISSYDKSVGVLKYISKFRPIQSERDRVIDLACNTIGSCGDSLSIKGIAKSLYDAGMLKEPTSNG